MNASIPILSVVIGAVVLLFGRKLFWLCVAAIGFAAGVTLAAMLARADPRDALLSRDGAGLLQLPRGARLGTSSLRRRAFLARLRPDVVLAELRGNVPTRIARLNQGDYDAIILASAGLERLGLKSDITEYLKPQDFPPAVSQGVIGIAVAQLNLHGKARGVADDHSMLG